jgi:LysR family cys regulon transcriptional activator
MLHQGRPTELAQMLLEGEADIAIATESLLDSPDIVAYPTIPGITGWSFPKATR